VPFRVAESEGAQPDAGVIARLHRDDHSYEIQALEAHPLCINGERVSAKRLEPRDLIEFGEKGPLSRFQLYPDGTRVRKSVGEIVGDCIDYTRVSRKPMDARVGGAFRDLISDMTLRTTVLFRISVVLAIVVLAATVIHQSRTSVQLKQKVASDALKLESFASALARSSTSTAPSSPSTPPLFRNSAAPISACRWSTPGNYSRTPKFSLSNDADAYGVAREAKSNGLKRPFAMTVGQIDWLPW
jgi:serine protease Do